MSSRTWSDATCGSARVAAVSRLPFDHDPLFRILGDLLYKGVLTLLSGLLMFVIAIGSLAFIPIAGQAGTADIVVFRGTLVEYLLAEPEDAISP